MKVKNTLNAFLFSMPLLTKQTYLFVGKDNRSDSKKLLWALGVWAQPFCN